MEYKTQTNNYHPRSEVRYKTKEDYYIQSFGGMHDSFRYKILQTSLGNYN